MRIGELARLAGVTTKAVRYYESLGLLAPARLANGYRDYGEHDVRVTREIRTLGRLGIPAEATRPFLECLALGHRHADDCPAALAGYRDAIDELTQRIEGLTARRAVLMAHLREAAHRNSRFAPAHGGEPMNDPTNDPTDVPSNPRVTDHAVLPAGLPVPEDDGAADHLPGARMPRLELPATDGSTVDLGALGAGRTVLYVYPLTGRPDTDLPEGWHAIPGARGCTAESCGFRDHHQDLLAAGAARVYGLSSQNGDYQREVTARLRLPFRMLSDPARRLARALDLPTFTADGLTLYRRLTLIVRDGAVEHVFHPVFPPDEHAGRVLAWLRAHPVRPWAADRRTASGPRA
ncbi:MULTISPECIES: MerR family DNA-binding transcriptional regulator [Kitasatospora]|uniref:Putative MerR family transcriptional regulator/peroxidase n=1 Tax=Kitasatospora setae (strain ATCC 33774 / DSM 43861 / JCM 3304 / KCC A-0304 / NBRC 14216 / KM-6054) TaxID=452652 RepID=E4N781_KITSK|nr:MULTISPECIES: MerR family DNA-binding transcriptional regulator [Kitasatospora]BAJ27062.1 putative MerR family transcriptional regulator/peroxidase [Kitasatospora setae KM-6054]